MHDMLRMKDFWSGALMIAIGAAFLTLSFSYSFGDGRGIGPGTFPALVASLLMIVGACLVIRSGMSKRASIENIRLRPLCFVILAVLVFGALLPVAGLAPATVALVLISALAMSGFGLRNASLLAVAVVVFGYAVFIAGLKLPISLIHPLPGF